MKKILVLVICLFLTSCGNNTISNLDINAASNDLDSLYTNMYEMDKNELLVIYGLDVDKCDEYVIKASSLSNGNFYAILKVNSDNMNEIKNQMNYMFDVLENQSNLYSPEAKQKIENRLETNIGDFLIYLVGDDTDELYECVKAHIN